METYSDEFDDNDHLAEFGGIKKAYKKNKEKKKEKEREKEIERKKHEQEMDQEGIELARMYNKNVTFNEKEYADKEFQKKDKENPSQIKTIKLNFSEKTDTIEKIYNCFIIQGENNKIKITGCKQNTYDIVQAGYKGVKIDDYDHLDNKERYYLVYSKRNFAASNILLLASSISVENAIDEFYDNFPIIIKCMDYQFTESSFIDIFLSIMYSIKNHRESSEEDMIKMIDKKICHN